MPTPSTGKGPTGIKMPELTSEQLLPADGAFTKRGNGQPELVLLPAELCAVYTAPEVLLPQFVVDPPANTPMGVVPAMMIARQRMALLSTGAWPIPASATTVLYLKRPHGRRRSLEPANERCALVQLPQKCELMCMLCA